MGTAPESSSYRGNEPVPARQRAAAPGAVLDGFGLDADGVALLADGVAEPAVPPEAYARAERSWHTARELAASGRIYGRDTGVGANRMVFLSDEDKDEQDLRLLRSHAGGVGALLPAREVRAMLAVRANQVLAGGSGLQPALVRAMVEALRLHVHPAVNEYGAVGTGDLTALAQTGLTLIGERPWLVDPVGPLGPELDPIGAGARGAEVLGADAATPPGALRPAGGTRGRAPGDGIPADHVPAQAEPPGVESSAPESSVPESSAAEASAAEAYGVEAYGVEPAGGDRAGAGTVGAGPGVGVRADPYPDEGPLAPLRTSATATGPAPVALQRGDGLALMSSNALALGQAALVCHDVDVLLRASHAVAALSLAAVGGSLEAYAAPVHALRPYAGTLHAAAEVRRLLGQPERPQVPARRIQDPYGFRAFPQVHGPALESVGALRRVVGVEINCPPENPLISEDGGPDGGPAVYHHGGFFAAPLGLSLDQLALAVLQTARLSAARLGHLGDPDITGLRPFLADGPAASSGIMILEYSANSALAELRAAASAPASAGHAVISRGLEEAASFASQAARQALRAAGAYRLVLACELVAAVRALRAQPTALLAADAPVRAVLASPALPAGPGDRPLTADVTAATLLLPALAAL
ncbi:putative histidine ammonia-lyase [Actinacidiphila reveromycinica]|uniref:Putative histidine ammonia-lyase n=1 Tax=Actinacidiphila reveromycinica TaxID=659352 RepID=A0A7U3UWL2_9ACTN|nr:aromatic amino acid lyase [Streptomyces sp. SN-593]BBB00095.1 putative histidine ammonia-lyase [Streptomyces sp. SN-593]